MNDSLRAIKGTGTFEETGQWYCRVYTTSSSVIILSILFQASGCFDRLPSIGGMFMDEAPDLSFDWVDSCGIGVSFSSGG